ncbi:MAG TPA: replicative DNA helicase [Chloroflexota bacterium]|nr:replicative DNA helicase [Chloroflexota bacterium]
MAIAPAALEKLPPSNVDAEQAVIGSLLLDRDAIVTISQFLLPEDFFREGHRLLYEAALALYEQNQPSDIVTLTDRLERLDQLAAVGGVAYIHSLATVVPTAIHVEYYARIVERTAMKRRLISVGGRIAAIGYNDALEVDDAFDRAEQQLFELTERRVKRAFTPIAEVVTGYFDSLAAAQANAGKITGLPTSFQGLDNLLGGLQKSDLVVLAARPAMGKTALVLNVAENVARAGHAVAMFNLEMSAEQLVQRMIACRAGVNLQHLRNGGVDDLEYPRVIDAMRELSEIPIFFDDSGNLTVMELRSKARRLSAEEPIELIIIDYLQLMHGRGSDNRVQEVSEITRSLKSLARELNIPVLAVSQLSRLVESRQSHVPQLSDLRESGSIEQDADIVMFIYRDEIYNKESDKPGVADVIIAKHRNGPIGDVSLRFYGSYQLFKDLDTRAAPRTGL